MRAGNDLDNKYPRNLSVCLVLKYLQRKTAGTLGHFAINLVIATFSDPEAVPKVSQHGTLVMCKE